MTTAKPTVIDTGGSVGTGARKLYLRELQAQSLDAPTPAPLSPSEIRQLRDQANLSQAAFGQLLGTTKGTVAQWEQGVRSPIGSALKLLDLVRRKGLDVLR